jgi:hypothetical protein
MIGGGVASDTALAKTHAKRNKIRQLLLFKFGALVKFSVKLEFKQECGAQTKDVLRTVLSS